MRRRGYEQEIAERTESGAGHGATGFGAGGHSRRRGIGTARKAGRLNQADRGQGVESEIWGQKNEGNGIGAGHWSAEKGI